MQTQTDLPSRPDTRVRALAPLAPGRKALIVGILPTNIDPDLFRDKRFVFWQNLGNGKSDYKDAVIPTGVDIILTTRFISHADLTRIRRDAKQREIYIDPNAYTTGELRRAMRTLAGLDAHDDASTTLTAKLPLLPTYPNGKAYLTANFKLAPNQTIRAWADEHYPLLAPAGVRLTQESWYAAALRYARELGIRDDAAAKARPCDTCGLPMAEHADGRCPVPAEAHVVEEPVQRIAVVAPAPLVDGETMTVVYGTGDTKAAVTTTDLPPELATLDAMLAEQISVVANVSAALEMAREQIAKVNAENLALKARFAKLKALMDGL